MRLAGACVLVTRARQQASALIAQIEAAGGTTYPFPVITILDPTSWAPLDDAIAQMSMYQWLVITSPNGATQFTSRLADRAKLRELRVAAVGSTTAKQLERLGIHVDLVPVEFRGAALPMAMAPLLTPGDRVLMPRGDRADPALAIRLRALGAHVDEVIAYRTVKEGGDVAALHEALRQGRIQYVTLTSSSTVVGLLERIGGPEALVGVRIAVIGPETRKTAEALGVEVHVQAAQATIESLVAAVTLDWEAYYTK
jgi:uroporphyrinogen III methyltransferase/synthase